MDSGQRLVDRMPINPKLAVFESTQERSVLLTTLSSTCLFLLGISSLQWTCIYFYCFNFRFEIPIRPGMRSSYVAAGGPPSSSKRPSDPSVVRKRNASYDPTGHIMEEGCGRGRKKVASRKTNESVHPTVDGVLRKKKRSFHRYSKDNNASGNSRQLTDYFGTSEGTEVLMHQSIEFSCYKYTHNIYVHRYSLISWWTTNILIACK